MTAFVINNFLLYSLSKSKNNFEKISIKYKATIFQLKENCKKKKYLISKLDKDFLNYNAQKITVLEGLEPVRRRPGVFIGSTGIKGFHHLAYEIIDNSIDEALGGYCKNIVICLNKRQRKRNTYRYPSCNWKKRIRNCHDNFACRRKIWRW